MKRLSPIFGPRQGKLCLALTVVFLFLFVCCKDGQSSSLSSFSFVQWSDVHMGEAHTRVEEWQQAFADGIAVSPRALVCTGDVMDNKNLTAEAFQARSEAWLREYVPAMLATKAPILFCYGNNDFYRNYNTEPSNFAPVATAYSQALGDAYYLDDLGNGVYPRRVGGMTWLSLNTLVFSPANSYAGRGIQATRTLEWLSEQVDKYGNKTPLVILAHIPPTYDAYDHKSAWDAPSLRKFRDILVRAQKPVVILSGHFHRNEQHAIALDGNRVAVVLDAGGISRKYGYVANYRHYRWTMNGNAGATGLAWTICYPSEKGWNTQWSVSDPFTSEVWTAFLGKLRTDEAFYRKFTLDFWSHASDYEKLASPPAQRQGILDEVFVKVEEAN